VDVLQFNVMEKNGIVSGCIGCGVYDHPMLKGWRVGGNMGWGGKASQFVLFNVGCSLLAMLKYRDGKAPQFVFFKVGCSLLAMLKYRGGKASQFVFLNVGCSLLAILKYRGGKIPQFVFLNVGCSPLAMLKYRGVRLRSLSPSMWEAVFLLC
jgi:hypothetical protein